MTHPESDKQNLTDGRRHRVEVERVSPDWGTNSMEQTVVILNLRMDDGTALRYRGRSNQMLRAIGEEYLPHFALTAAFELHSRGRARWLDMINPNKLHLILREDGLPLMPETLEGAWHLYTHDHSECEDGKFWVFSGDTLMQLWLRVRETPVTYRIEDRVLWIGKRDYVVRFLDADQMILEYGDNYLVYRRYRKPIDLDHFRFAL